MSCCSIGALEGSNQAGTGNPLSFGIKNIPGQYSIRGINPVGNCEQIMNDTVTVIMNPIPVTDFEANTVCNSDTTFFTVSGNYVDKISNWHWDFGVGTFHLQCPDQPISYLSYLWYLPGNP
ncbi:MAG: hypothetical protein IPH84_16840 [Bacteroidales bacterium]|nr:hypothetical protein [Bacteroidales bacterium]